MTLNFKFPNRERIFEIVLNFVLENLLCKLDAPQTIRKTLTISFIVYGLLCVAMNISDDSLSVQDKFLACIGFFNIILWNIYYYVRTVLSGGNSRKLELNDRSIKIRNADIWNWDIKTTTNSLNG